MAQYNVTYDDLRSFLHFCYSVNTAIDMVKYQYHLFFDLAIIRTIYVKYIQNDYYSNNNLAYNSFIN